jgi:mannose-6-phosphate isomerase-like protein (cupin superfamily)
MSSRLSEKLKPSPMFETSEWFDVRVTTKHTQTAVMKLGPGQSTGEEPEAHRESEQVLLLVTGELWAEIGSEHFKMKAGMAVTIPPGTKHRFTNRSKAPALTFNVYAPPEYPPNTKG